LADALETGGISYIGMCKVAAELRRLVAENERLNTERAELLEALRDMVDHGDATAFAKARAVITRAEVK
jgi:uncharacterized protein (UPF0335 family)